MLKSAVAGGGFLSLWRPFNSKGDPAYTPLTPIGSIKSLVNYLRLLIDHKKHGKMPKMDLKMCFVCVHVCKKALPPNRKCAPLSYTYAK